MAINKTQGLKDQFQAEAFSALAMNPDKQIFLIDMVEGRAERKAVCQVVLHWIPTRRMHC